MQERSQEGKKHGFHYACAEYYLQRCSQIQLDGIAHEQTIICRQLFAGHVVGSRPMKRKKNLLRMIYIDNRLICMLPAHCMISKSNVKLGSVHATIRPHPHLLKKLAKSENK